MPYKAKHYALFTGDVKAEDKYKVTTPPGILFKSKEEAKQYARKKGWFDDIKIMKY